MYSCDFEAVANAFGSCDVASRRQVRAYQQSSHQGAPSARSARLSRSRRNRGNDHGDADADDDIDHDGNDDDDDNDDENGDIERNDSENGQARGNDGVQRGSIAVGWAHAPIPGEQLRASP